MPGFSLGQRIKGKLGMRSSTTAELVFESVPVPADHLLGEENKARATFTNFSYMHTPAECFFLARTARARP